MVISPEGYQDIEYETPKKVFISKGHEVITTSTEKTAKGSMGGITKTDLLLNDVDSSDYDAVAFIGGPGSPIYFDHKPALKLAQDFYNAGKITAAICAAPSTLANAGLLNGKIATCFEGQSQNLLKNGAKYTGAPVEQDKTIITANGPASAQLFGQKIVEALE